MRYLRWVEWAQTEVAALYNPRTGASAKYVRSMTKGQAKRIEFMFRDLSYIFDPAWYRTRRVRMEDQPLEYWTLECCWFMTFWKPVKDM